MASSGAGAAADGSPAGSLQVVAVSSPGSPGWRWRIVGYSGEMIEESYETFPSIRGAVVSGEKRLAEMNISASHLRGR